MDFEGFQKWLDVYSFIRDLIRNVALMPRMWSLDDNKSFIISEESAEKLSI